MSVVYFIYYGDLLLYAGSSIIFENRKSKHKSDCFNEKSKKYNKHLYKYIRDHNIDFDSLIWKTIEFEYITS